MTTSLALLNNQLPVRVHSLEHYITAVQQIPMLTLEEEQELTQRYFSTKDLAAARRLILAHMRFVVRVARGYLGYGLAFADLIQEGSIGLMKAVQRFNPGVGVRLVTFAIHWIKAEIHEYIIRNWRIVKIATTKAQRKLFFNLRQLKNKTNGLNWFTQDEIQDVAKELSVSPEEVARMEARLQAHDTSFDLPVGEDDEHAFVPAQYLEDHRYDPQTQLEASNSLEYNSHAVLNALEELDERSQHIIRSRWLVENKATLHELAAHFNVSAERIRQLEKTAMDKLKTAMLALAA